MHPMKTTLRSHPAARLTAIAAALLAAGAAHANGAVRASEGIGYYVGIDGLATFASGTYSGLANPNNGRLTLLHDYGSNHFHGIGSYSYTGPAASAMVRATNANNRLPELSRRVSPASSAIPLQAGSGAYAGRWVSTGVPESAPTHGYSLLGMASMQSLPSFGAAGNVLYNSSAGRWKTSRADAQVGLQLVTASAGLTVGMGSDLDIFAQGNTYALGDSAMLTFLPTFHLAQGAAAGTYSATLRLVGLGGSTPAMDGGQFHIDFLAPVPEPQAALLMVLGLAGLALARMRRRQGTAADDTRSTA